MNARAPLTSAAPELTDGELFRRIAEGDLGPLGVLFDRHHAAIRAFVARMTGDASDVDDLVQETFLTASRAAGSFEASAPARPFLFGVAAQLLRRRRRGLARLRAFLDALARAPTEAPPSQHASCVAAEERARLHAAVARLPLEHRLVVGMVDLGELSGVDAAKALGVPVGTVWRRLHEARARLRAALSEASP